MIALSFSSAYCRSDSEICSCRKAQTVLQVAMLLMLLMMDCLSCHIDQLMVYDRPGIKLR